MGALFMSSRATATRLMFRPFLHKVVGGLLMLTGLGHAASDVNIVLQVPKDKVAGGTYGGTNPVIFTPAADVSYALRTNIETALDLGRSVTINTESAEEGAGDLILTPGLQKINGGNSTLTLNAVRDLVINGYAYSSSGNLSLVMNAGRNMSNSQVLNSSGGNLTLNVAQVFELGANLKAGTGLILVQNGILTALTPMTLSGASVQFSAASALRFPGTIEGNLVMAGSLSPGAPRASKNLKIQGNLGYVTGAKTLIELAGTVAPGSSYDRIQVTGNVVLGGSLEVEFLAGFEDRVQATDVFTILEGGAITGTFAGLAHNSRVTLPNSQGSFRIRYTATRVTLDDWQPVIQTLTWDPGTSLNGSQIRTVTNGHRGRHVFRLPTQAVATGAWRTRLTVTSGTAELYLAKGYIPTNLSFLHSAKAPAPTALILREDQYTAEEEWYVMVYASEGASWSLFSGEAYAHDAGALPYTDSNTNGRYDIGEATSSQSLPAVTVPAEKVLFYKVTVPQGIQAWSLWLNGASQDIAVRKDKVPFHISWPYYAKKQAGQMLLTAPALVPEGGTYYVAVEAAPGTSLQLDSRIQSVTPIPLHSTQTQVAVIGAPYRVYQVTVPNGLPAWKVSTTAVAGNPDLALRAGTVGSERDNNVYSEATGTATDSIILVQEELSPGPWYVTVHGTAAYTFTLTSTDGVTQPVDYDTPALAFNNGTASLSGHAPGTWIYRKVTVPEGVLGWDIRVRGVIGGSPQLVVRRDRLPASLATVPWPHPGLSSTWPIGHQWAGEMDWTHRPFEGGGAVPATPRRLVAAMGRPLEPGTYFVGIFNSHPSENAAWVLESRGIGSGQAFPVTTLATTGASQGISNLPVRDAAYFKVTLPAGLPSWRVSLSPTLGEMMFCLRRGAIPDFFADNPGGDLQGELFPQVRVQKTGAEHFVLLPPEGQNSLAAGDYYLAAVSEGTHPPSPYETGSGSSSGTLSTPGALTVTDLGSITQTGLSQAISLPGGQIRSYRFTLPANAGPLEVRLDNRTGNPGLSLVDGARIPRPRLSDPGDYGWSGGQQTGLVAEDGISLIHVSAPVAGTYHLTLRAGAVDGLYPDATATLVVRTQAGIALNLDAALNGNGLSHQDTRQLLEGQRALYQFTIPATVSGQPLLGWLLSSNASQGSVRWRVFKAGDPPESAVQVSGPTALIVPPLLTPGDWRVEAEAIGLTNYTLTSRHIGLNQAAWTMPAGFGQNVGDTGSVPLAANGWHFYAVDVPAGNAGLLRTDLQALSGNPDLYIREDGVPTPDHDSQGPLGSSQPLVHRRLDQTGDEYGNWVPVKGRDETALRPGRWFLAVRAAGGAAAQYRLRLTTGQMTSLPLASGALAGQFLARGDWRYYQFTLPVNAPENWLLTFSETVGDVVMWIRDTLPPGTNAAGHESTDQGPNSGVRSWYGDAKNQGPYTSGGYGTPGVHTFSTAPLRPGHTYFVGFQARTDATFSLQSGTSGSTLPQPPLLDYQDGTATASLAAGTSVLYRVTAPANATRLMWQATHPASVQVRVEEGTLPGTDGLQHWTSGAAADSLFNQSLSATAWPWRPGRTFYLRVVNHGSSTAPFAIQMNGRTPANADEDLDRLPDAWETLYYTDIHDATITTDTDEDGLTNLVEFAFNLNPLVNALPILTPDTGLAGLPYVGIGPNQRLRVEFLRRRLRGLGYEVQFSDDAIIWQPATAVPAVTSINGEWERVVVEDEEALSGSPQRFARVVVRVVN